MSHSLNSLKGDYIGDYITSASLLQSLLGVGVYESGVWVSLNMGFAWSP